MYVNIPVFLVFLLLVNEVINFNFTLQNSEYSELKIKNVLDSFINYHIIFHTDSTSVDYVNKVMTKLNSHNAALQNYITVQIYNHDFDYNEEEVYKINSNQVLHVLMSESPHFWKNLVPNLRVTYSNVVIFMSRLKNVLKKVKKQASNVLKYAGNSLIIQLNNSNNKIFRSCYYCGDQSKQFTLISSMNANEAKIRSTLLLPHDFKDLNRHVLNVMFMQYYPYVYCKDIDSVNEVNDSIIPIVCKKLGGIESKLLETLSKKMNFDYIVHTLGENGTFFEMILYVSKKYVDVALGGVSITEERMSFVQFTSQYNLEDYVFLYLMKHTFAEIFEKFSEPFRASLVWFLYICSFFLTAFCVYICSKYGRHDNISEKLSLEYIIWILLHTPFEQSSPGIKKFKTNFSSIIIMSFWWTITMIMITVYKSSVLSSMVHPPNVEPDNLEELIDRGFRVAGNIHYQDIVKEILDVNDTVYRHALYQAAYADGPCDTFSLTLNGGVAMLDELSEIQYELRTVCPQYYPEMVNDFRITRKSVRSTGHGWALQKGAPYQQAINYYISLILSGGLYTKWINDETAKGASKLFRKSREMHIYEAEMLSFKRFKPLIFIYIVGIFCATICFLGEILINIFKPTNYTKSSKNRFKIRTSIFKCNIKNRMYLHISKKKSRNKIFIN